MKAYKSALDKYNESLTEAKEEVNDILKLVKASFVKKPKKAKKVVVKKTKAVKKTKVAAKKKAPRKAKKSADSKKKGR
jgi:hypothetical protein